MLIPATARRSSSRTKGSSESKHQPTEPASTNRWPEKTRQVMGEAKNTSVVSTSQGRTIPDFQNPTQVGEIKDTARVSDSSQLRAQREHAQATGREHVVVTGSSTQVSGTVQSQSTVIRRDDLGPGSR